MVTIGFSYPRVAKYSAAGTTVTYSGGMALGRGVSVSLDVESASDNNFYADNRLAESETGVFTSGTLTATVDGLDNAAATLILGLPAPESVTVNEEPVKMQGYGDAIKPPYVGFGFVWATQQDGVISYYPVVYPKVKFGIPGEERNTKEDQTDWQTQELEATVMRDDTTAHNWRRVAVTGFATEEEALAVVDKILSITEE